MAAIGAFAVAQWRQVRTSLFVFILFSDMFIMFAGRDHRYGDGTIVPGKFGDCVLKQSLNDQLAAVRRQPAIFIVQFNDGDPPHSCQ